MDRNRANSAPYTNPYSITSTSNNANNQKKSKLGKPSKASQLGLTIRIQLLLLRIRCKPLICLWSLFEIFHIFCEGSAGRGIINKEKPNADLLANCFRGDLILC